MDIGVRGTLKVGGDDRTDERTALGATALKGHLDVDEVTGSRFGEVRGAKDVNEKIKKESTAIEISEKCLGSGGWGKVLEGKYCGCTVAIKKIYEDLLKSSPHYRELFEREMDIASRCHHPCLLQFIGATNDEESPLFVTEFMETSLRKLVEERPLFRSESSVISLDVAHLDVAHLDVAHLDVAHLLPSSKETTPHYSPGYQQCQCVAMATNRPMARQSIGLWCCKLCKGDHDSLPWCRNLQRA
ncbi:putative tyrosine-protein kinase [Stylophora pistillata]|uniref:Putative tyrosine-protein kinase n=1 Tax=Stylophora pistillata TaxID=50429 RepID=A0A2B4RRU9_STYPI|nr:putative tyrosine-protein kinase [Stylophora pistillata]